MADEHLVTVYGTSAMVCAPDGIPFDTDGAATDLVGEAISHRAEIVVVPVERLTDDFFDLSTGVAGVLAQKFATYQLRLAVIGDVQLRSAGNEPFDDWVAECNGGTQLWFCATFDDLKARLDRRAS